MPTMNWDQTPPKRPGTYHVEVESCVLKTGQSSGEAYLQVGFKDLSDDEHLCFDIISFSQRAKGIAQAKLSALGFTDKNINIEAMDLIGRRVHIATIIDTYEGESRLKVSLAASGFKCGYRPENFETPPVQPVEGLNDDIPF